MKGYASPFGCGSALRKDEAAFLLRIASCRSSPAVASELEMFVAARAELVQVIELPVALEGGALANGDALNDTSARALIHHAHGELQLPQMA